ncbi:dc11 acn9 [Holotrichia oblita]|nr:dc11 acn9 [Holotrichia oblita]
MTELISACANMNSNISSHIQRVRILYKTILKLHRGLPVEVQPLGNSYAKQEFKRHKKCTPEQAAVFMNEWTDYALTLAKQIGIRGPKTRFKEVGRSLSEQELKYFRDEQVQQLYELMVTASNSVNSKT